MNFVLTFEICGDYFNKNIKFQINILRVVYKIIFYLFYFKTENWKKDLCIKYR